MQEASPRVLSIQSHVVSGYVGNKSATFPLQILGFEVDAINSVQFSNHTGYGSWQGQVLNEDDLSALTAGLAHNKLDSYSHLLTGYVGSPSFLSRIAELVKHLREVNPQLVYVCDPVMGDNGRMYVPEELLPIYRDQIVPLADIITPNQYEAERLTGISITDVDQAWRAMQLLHAKGPTTVVLSSTELGDQDFLLGLASSSLGGQQKRVTIKIPKLAATFTGTGDLFAALFLACMHRSGGDLQDAVERTVCTLQAVLRRTFAHAQNSCEGGALSKRALELRLIQSKADIESPTPTISAVVT